MSFGGGLTSARNRRQIIIGPVRSPLDRPDAAGIRA